MNARKEPGSSHGVGKLEVSQSFANFRFKIGSNFCTVPYLSLGKLRRKFSFVLSLVIWGGKVA